MNQETRKIVSVNENMLRYVDIEVQNQAYLDAICALNQIEKDLSHLKEQDKDSEQVRRLNARIGDKKQQILRKAAHAIPKTINYGDHPIETAETEAESCSTK